MSPKTAIPPELIQRIRVILAQSDPDHLYMAVGGSSPVSSRDIRWQRGKPSPLIIEDQGQYQLVNEQVLLLRGLYAASPPLHQRYFETVLSMQLDEKNAAIVAHAFVELRFTEVFRHWERLDAAALELWSAVTAKLAIEHWVFTNDDLRCLSGGMHRLLVASGTLFRESTRHGAAWIVARDMQSLSKNFGEVLARVEYLRLRAEIRSLGNPAIDTDRRILMHRLGALGLSDQLGVALNEVEKKSTAAATELDFKGAMDLLRTFFEKFCQEVAAKVTTVTGVPLPAGDKPFAPWKDYLRTSGLLTEKEADLLQKLYNYLSTEGAHQLGTGAEQLSVSHVTVVEWCMMIAGRLQKLSD